MQFPDHDLARHLQTTLALQHIVFSSNARRACPGLGIDIRPLGGLANAVYAGPNSPFSRVSGLGVCEPATAEQFEMAEQFFSARNEPCRVDVCPFSDPSLTEHVSARGYTLGTFTNVYFRPPPTASEDLSPPTGLRVEEVDRADAPALDRTMDVIHRGFEGPTAVRNPMWRMVRASLDLSMVRLFAAYIDGVDAPIAGGSMEFIGHPDGRVVAALAGAATHEAHRNRGGQTAMIRARLGLVRERLAQGLDCDLVMIQTRPGTASERNILRHGFRLAYTRPQMVRATV